MMKTNTPSTILINDNVDYREHKVRIREKFSGKIVVPTFDVVDSKTGKIIAFISIIGNQKPIIIFSEKILKYERIDYADIFESEIGRIQITICDHSEINEFKVRELQRKKGVGRLLLKIAEEIVLKEGHDTLDVAPSSAPYKGDNRLSLEKLIEVYGCMGFKKLSFSDSTSTHTEGTVKLRKYLLKR